MQNPTRKRDSLWFYPPEMVRILAETTRNDAETVSNNANRVANHPQTDQKRPACGRLSSRGGGAGRRNGGLHVADRFRSLGKKANREQAPKSRNPEEEAEDGG